MQLSSEGGPRRAVWRWNATEGDRGTRRLRVEHHVGSDDVLDSRPQLPASAPGHLHQGPPGKVSKVNGV